jgi:hypothetical protein
MVFVRAEKRLRIWGRWSPEADSIFFCFFCVERATIQSVNTKLGSNDLHEIQVKICFLFVSENCLIKRIVFKMKRRETLKTIN